MPRTATRLTLLTIASLGACSAANNPPPPVGGADSGTSSSSSGGYDTYDSGSEPLDAGTDDAPSGPTCVDVDGDGGGVYGCWGNGSTAYSCPTDAAPPSSSTSITCAYYGEDPPNSLYCCTQGPCTPSDITSTCAFPGASNWTCVGSASPIEQDPSLTCTTLGVGMFCCHM